jgi:hypothetical protein
VLILNTHARGCAETADDYSDRMDYDNREALHLLTNARAAKYSHEYDAKRDAAATRLLAAVLDTVRAAGFTPKKDRAGDDVFVPNAATSGRIWFKASADGVLVGFGHLGPDQRLDDPEIEYDAAADQWVGTGPEVFFTPVPGERPARRSAVAAVIDRVLEALKKIP